MDILLVANTSWYIYNFRSNLIKTLIANNYKISVLSPYDSYSEKIESLGIKHINLKIDKSGINPVNEFFTLLRLMLTLRKEKPSLILTYTPKINIYISIVSRLLRIPVIANVSGLGSSFISGGIITRITSILYRLSFNWPYKVFFQNNEDLNEFIKRGFVEKIKAERLPGSGVDLNKFRPVKTKKREKITFLLVARLLWDKGIGEYISAAREIQKKYFNTEFQIIGFADSDNPSAIPKSNIDRWVEEGIINYLGYTDNIMEKYANVDCVVLPSYYREGVPRSLLEAASMAIPIITTSAVGCRDVVDDGINGFLCQPKNVNDLTAKIERMILLTHDQRREMGLKGREKMIKFFDEKIVINKYLNVIKSCEQISTKTFIEKIFEYLFSFVFRFKGN